MADRLGLKVFADIYFHHHPLILGTDGNKLSKSAGSTALRALRGAGQGPEELVREAERYVEDLLRSINT